MNSLTLFDVINAVGEYAKTPNELKAVVIHLVNSGTVKLDGDLAGCKIDFGPNAARQLVTVGSQTVAPTGTGSGGSGRSSLNRMSNQTRREPTTDLSSKPERQAGLRAARMSTVNETRRSVPTCKPTADEPVAKRKRPIRREDALDASSIIILDTRAMSTILANERSHYGEAAH